MMDKNGKLFGKISIVDLIVIVLIIAILGGTAWRFTSPNAALSQADAVVEYTIRIEGVRDFTLQYYHEGLRVYDRQAGQFIGRISDVRSGPHYEPHPLLDGTVAWKQVPGQLTIYIDVVAAGRVTPTAVFVEGTYEIAAGSLRYINTKYVQTSGTIYSVDIR